MRRLVDILILAMACAGCGERKEPDGPDAPAAQRRGPILLTLIGRERKLIVRGGPQGPVYSLNANDGRVLVANMTLDELMNSDNPYAHDVTQLLADHVMTADVPLPDAVR